MTGLVLYVGSSINGGSRLRTYIQPSKIKYVSGAFGELLKEIHNTDRETLPFIDLHVIRIPIEQRHQLIALEQFFILALQRD